MTYCVVFLNEVSKHYFVPEKPLIDLRERERERESKAQIKFMQCRETAGDG